MIPPLTPLDIPNVPTSNVTPFTHRDGLTFLWRLERLAKYIDKVVVPHVNDSYKELADNILLQINAVIASVNNGLDEQNAEVDAKITALEESVEQTRSTLVTYVNEKFDAIVEGNIDIQDPIFAEIINLADSDTRQALDNLFAEKATVDDLTTIVNGIADLVNTGRLTETALNEAFISPVELSTAVTNLTNQINDAVNDLTELINLPTFDFENSFLDFGIRLGPVYGLKKMPQSMYISRKLDGEIFYSIPTAGTTSERESLAVIRCAANGLPIEKMTFTDGGHGNITNVEVDANGNLFVWVEYPNYANPGGTLYNTARIPWQANATYTLAMAQPYIIPVLSGKTTSLTVSIDEHAQRVGVRENIENNVAANFSTHTLANLINNIWAPVQAPVRHDYANSFTQGWTYHDNHWYIIHGTINGNVPYTPARIDKVSSVTGLVVATRNIERSRMGAFGMHPGGASEPEGVTVAYGPNNRPVIVFGMGGGPVAARFMNLWYMHNGFSPFRATNQRADRDADSTAWDASAITFQGGFSTRTDDLKFAARINGEWIEVMGQIEGDFITTAGNTIGVIAEQYRPAKTSRLVAAKNQGSTSQGATARVEILTNGNVVVYLPRTDTGNGTWVDIPWQRIPRFSLVGLGA